MIYYLEMKSQLKRIIKNLGLLEETKYSNCNSKSSSSIKDIKDGLAYQRILSSVHGALIKKNEAFTFTMNTDGVTISEEENLTIWPVYLAINEIDVQSRFCLENMVIVGKRNTF